MLLDDYRANDRRSINRVEDAMKPLREFFGEIRLAKLTPDRFTAYQVQRKAEGAANATVNYDLAMLRRGFRLGARAGKVAARPEFTMLHAENARRGFFAPDQYRAVLEHLPDYLKPLAQASYITGWRTKSELLTRQWRHVDLAPDGFVLTPDRPRTAKAGCFH